MKNLNQGIEGVQVDDLLQLSYLQRLARQKVAEMEVCLLSFSPSCIFVGAGPPWDHQIPMSWNSPPTNFGDALLSTALLNAHYIKTHSV